MYRLDEPAAHRLAVAIATADTDLETNIDADTRLERMLDAAGLEPGGGEDE